MHDDDGKVTAFVVVIITAVLMFAGLVLDGGLALSAKVRAMGEAQDAARAGAQAIDLAAYRANGSLHLVPSDATASAPEHLTSTGHTGTVTVVGDTVTVTVTITHDTRLLAIAGVDALTVTGRGRAHPRNLRKDRELANSEVVMGEN